MRMRLARPDGAEILERALDGGIDVDPSARAEDAIDLKHRRLRVTEREIAEEDGEDREHVA